jgi:hypothetical protein
MNTEEQITHQLNEVEKPKRNYWSLMKKITGWAMLAAAIGILLEIVIPRPPGEGTIGLIPLYIGFPFGAVGFVMVMWKNNGWFAAIMAAIGLLGILYFMFAYPNGVHGWIGGFFLGISSLYLPLPYRFAALTWIGVGFWGVPEIYARAWGFLDAFSMFGISTAFSGAYILWGSHGNVDDQ